MIDINKIAKLITEDPDIFNEAGKKPLTGRQQKKASKAIKKRMKNSEELQKKSKEHKSKEELAKHAAAIEYSVARRESKKRNQAIVEDNEPDEDDFDKEFRVLLGLEDKPEPADPSKKDRNQKSPNNKLDGAKQSGKPYLEARRDYGSCPGCFQPLQPDGGARKVGDKWYCLDCARRAQAQQGFRYGRQGPPMQ